MRWRRKTGREQDLERELRSHLDSEAAEQQDGGLSAGEARYAAQRAFGNMITVKEAVREIWGWTPVEQFGRDLQYGLRLLVKDRSFTAVTVATLALAIGANTSIFSVVNGVVLNPLPYWEPDQLVSLYSGDSRGSTSYLNFLDWARDNPSFSTLAAYRPDSFSLTGMAESERIPAEMVSTSFFPLLGVDPSLGRNFLPAEDQLGAPPVVMLSGSFWKRKFASSPDVLGKPLTLNGITHTVVGVIPSGFRYYARNFQVSDVYVPIGQLNIPGFHDRKISNGMDVVGRLKPGITFDRARASMKVVANRLAEQFPEADKGTTITLVPLKQDIVGSVEPLLLMLLAAVVFVLLIACVNVGNLMLARSNYRAREMAIRNALGASRGRVIWQLLTESILLAMMGGGLGCLIAFWGTGAGLRLLPSALPRTEDIQVDWRVLLFTAAVSMLAGVMFGLAPAIKASRPDLQETLKEAGRGSSGVKHRTQRVLVAIEMALALVLMVGAGLMIRSFATVWGVDPGFQSRNVLTARVSFPPALTSPAAIRSLWRVMDEKLLAVPGITATSLSVGSDPMGGDSEIPFWLEGFAKPSSQAGMNFAITYFVEPGYLQVMRIPLERGRFLTAEDNERSPLVTVIDDQFARRHFGARNPVGRRINLDILNSTAEIVGVVGHIKQWGLDESPASSLQAQCYFSAFQIPDRFMPMLAGDAGITFRTERKGLADVSSIRRALSQINSQLVMYRAQAMDEIIAGSLDGRRFSMILFGIFAALALIMSSIGIYGVISYLAGQRTHEIGIRVALGAGRADVLRMVLADAAKMALLGVAIGLAAAFGLTRLMASMLFGVSAHDPVAFVGVAGLLCLVAFAACCVPALRAMKADPMSALRHE